MLSLLRQRNFGLFFWGQFISTVGDLVLFVALPFWIYQLTGSALATGVMFGALTIPQIVLSPFAGVFVDRWDRKTTMIVADLLRAAIMFSYFAVHTADQVWLIYALAFAEACVSRFFRPAAAATLPRLVAQSELVRANAMFGLSDALAQLGGPALGGVLFAWFGPHGATSFDAISYLASAAALLLMRIRPLGPRDDRDQTLSARLEGVMRDLAHGVQVVGTRPLLRTAFLTASIFMLAQGIINVLLVVMVKKIWGGGSPELGWLVSAQGVGSLIGAMVIGRLSQKWSPRELILMGGAAAGIGITLIVNQPSIYVALGLMVLSSVPIVGVTVGFTTTMQLGADDENRGRVAALFAAGSGLAMLVSIVFTGAVADRVGVVPMLDLAGALMFVGGLIALAMPPRSQSIRVNSVAGE